MKTIVTGKINSGKTRTLRALHANASEGDGFAAVKWMEGSVVKGFDAMRLSTEETYPLIRRKGDEGGDTVAHTLGPYSFLRPAMERVEKEMDALIDSGVSPLFFDEAGLLEMEGKGFDGLIRRILAASADAFLVVRRDLLEAFLKRYDVDEYRVIKAGEATWT